MLIAAKLREEYVNNGQIKQRERQQENRYPATKAVRSRQTLKQLRLHKYAAETIADEYGRIKQAIQVMNLTN